MNGASRQVKNQLLSVAGEGFPFDNYAENAFLVPVTPAAPAILRDDAALDNLIGQETVKSHNSAVITTSSSTVDADPEFTPIPLHPEENDSPTNQPAKQGYLTSILSSLPNLSLSSITGDSSGSQVTKENENATSAENTNPYVPSQDRRDSLRDTSPPIVANFPDPRRSNFPTQTEVSRGNIGNVTAPPQSSLPPTLPSTINGPASYRLGNQKRLKYAPPPDLTSSAPKKYPSSTIQPVLAPQNISTPTIFNPNVVPVQSHQPVEPPVATNSPPSIPHSTPEYLSQTSSVQESFRSSPVAVGVPQGSAGTSRSITPQNQGFSHESIPEKPNLSLPAARSIPSRIFEPTTPQNTPATQSFFSFDAHSGQRDPLRRDINAEIIGPKAISSAQSSSPLPILKENTVKSNSDTKPTVTFAPVSAVQVSEKLEHLLAQQNHDLPNQPAESFTNIETNTAKDGTIESSDHVKLDSGTENTLLTQTDGLNIPFHKQETSQASQQTTSSEPINKSGLIESRDTSSNVPIFQQYYQPQSYTSSVNFFDEPSKEPKPTSNYVSVIPPSTSNIFSTPHNVVTQNASSIFSASENNTDFPPFQQSESSVDAFVDVNSSRNAFEQVPLTSSIGSSFGNPTFSAPGPVWHGDQTFETVNATRETSVHSPTPRIFYNPAQLQSELPTTSTTSRFYAPPVVNQAVNQPYSFTNFVGTTQSRDTTTGGIRSAFLPASSAMTSVPEPSGSATLNPVQMSVNPLAGRVTTDSVPPNIQNVTNSSSEKRMQYRMVYYHWFYRKEVENKALWLPFSMQDSLRLEEVHNSTEITPETTVATDGGRYDVDILRRQRSPVYWNGASTEVRRCSWFYKGPTESRYIPYDENIAAKLEEEYKQACLANRWNRCIELSNGEYVVFHSASVQVHYLPSASPEMTATWGNSAGSEDSTYLQGAGSRPRVIKRGMDEFHIEDGEPEKIDHLLFLVHGIGSVCDLKFRSVEEVVDEFRSISLQLVQSHYRTASEQRIVNRIEVLPISWHTTLHSEDTGIDKKLQAITLESIPKLRHFTNDTLLDILFYTSPVYCQTIMQTVGSEINRLYALFKGRNPGFNGGIYLGGHSLGSLILFDLLCHQKPPAEKSNEKEEENNEEHKDEDNETSQTLPDRVLKRRLSKKISYVIGAAGTGQPYIHYPQLHFHPRAFFALGSPIGMFVTVRGIDMLGEDFVLPTCPSFFNIFHPFDPVAYRVEALINSDAPKYRPMLIPHHKGRKRMHLELKETMARVGADLKQKLLDSVRNTWNSVYQLAVFHKTDNTVLEREIDKVVEEQLQQTPTVPDPQAHDDGGAEFKVGKLNGGRRIDYVLQEAPFEYINEYIFALTSHVCYWESEDTMLMILKEVYGSSGIQTDAQLPQQTLSIERVPPSPALFPSSNKCEDRVPSAVPILGIDPTAPISEKMIGPPPKAGFVKK